MTRAVMREQIFRYGDEYAVFAISGRTSLKQEVWMASFQWLANPATVLADNTDGYRISRVARIARSVANDQSRGNAASRQGNAFRR